MSSPFQVFRHYQKQIMVVVTLLAVFAFVAADAVMSNSAMIIPCLGGLAGMSALYMLGQKNNQQWIYAPIGAVLGFIIASFAPTGPSQAVAVRTNVGNFSNVEMQESLRNISLANQLVNELQAKAFGFRFPRQAFIYSNTPEGNALMSQLYLVEAKKQGVTISDAMVEQFIHTSSAERLSGKDILEVFRRFRKTRDEVFDILRDQIAASTIMQMKQPTLLPSTSDYWDNFLKLNEQQELKVVAVPVSLFSENIGDPTDDQVAEFFESYKGIAEGDEPSFFQPDRIRLGYLEASYDSVAGTVTPPTDEEIAAYYEANKGRYIINPFDEPADPAPADPAPADPAPEATEEKTEEMAAPEKTDGEAKPEEPAETEAKAKPEEKPATEQKAEMKAEEKPAAPEEKKPEEKPADPKPAEETSKPEQAPGEPTSQVIQFPEGVLASLIQEEPAAEKPEAAKEETPESQPAEKAEAPTEKAAEKPVEAPKEEMPADEKTESAFPEGFEPVKKPEVIEQMEPTYRELDEALKAEIREELIQQKTVAKMADISNDASGFLIDLTSRFIGFRLEGEEESDDEEWLTDAEIKQAVEAYAKEKGLRYSETGWLSAQELMASQDHPIGSSTEPASNEFQRAQVRTVVDQVFGYVEKPDLYRAQLAEDPVSLNRFVHWTLDHEPQHEPTIEEPGVREQVIVAWKLKQAEALAQKRAEELVETLKTSDKTWAETIAGMTIDGTENTGSLGISYTGPFAWYRMGSSPSPSQPRPTLNLSSPPGLIGGATEELMETVFKKLAPGEVGIVWSQGRTNALVVQAENRTPDDELQTRFLAEAESIVGQQSVYNMLPNTERTEVYITWQEQFMKQYNVQWTESSP